MTAGMNCRVCAFRKRGWPFDDDDVSLFMAVIQLRAVQGRFKIYIQTLSFFKVAWKVLTLLFIYFFTYLRFTD